MHRVLVASDKPDLSESVRQAFQAKQVEKLAVVSVASPEELAPQMEGAIALLVDWQMDEVARLAFVETAAREGKGLLSVLLVCPPAMAGATFPALKTGATGVIAKPLNADELVLAVATAIRRRHPKRTPVNVEFINPFLEATANVFQTMMNMPVQRKKLFLKDDHRMLGDVSAVMGLSGAANGSVVLSLSRALACLSVARLLCVEPPPEEIDQDACDAVGELVNMIAGQAKTMLTHTKYAFNISLPTVVAGPHHQITHREETPNIVALFEAEGLDFALQVCLEAKK